MKKTLYTLGILVIGIAVAAGSSIYAGSLTPSAAPTTDATMYSLTAIYEKLTTGTTTESAGDLDAPETVSASQYTLEEIYNALPEWRTLSNATTTVAAGYYEATTLPTIDSDLTAENIVTGNTVFGISGSYVAPKGIPSTGTAVAPNILSDRTCSDGGTGTCDDSYYQKGITISGSRFTDNGDETISDAATGLMWTKSKSADSRWSTAISYCEDLALAGHTDWKLPNMIELYSIVDWDGSPKTYTEFAGLEGRLWSSTRHAFYVGSAHVVNVTTGYNDNDFMNDSITAAICVRDDA